MSNSSNDAFLTNNKEKKNIKNNFKILDPCPLPATEGPSLSELMDTV